MSKPPLRQPLEWSTDGVTWTARLPLPATRSLFRARFGLDKSVATFAFVRPARDANGRLNPAMGGPWMAVVVRPLPGATAFDLTTYHDSADAGKMHVESLAALEGLT